MLHTIWLGGGEKSPLLKRCEATWPSLRKEWNEQTLFACHAMTMKDAPYLHEALEAKHWAAASDLLRLVALWCFGGVYIDCDVEILRPDMLVEKLCLAGVGNRVIIGREDSVNVCGAVIVAPPRHPFIARMLDVYAGLSFKDTFEGSGGTVNGTTLLTREASGRNDVIFTSPEVFSPIHWSTIKSLSLEERHAVATEFKSITLHHYAGSWVK